MGSLALAGALGGLGEGMQENVRRENINEQNDLDRLHQERLQTIRDEATSGRQEQGQEFEVGRYDVERKDVLSDIKAEQEYEAGVAGATAIREDVVREDEQEHAIDIEAMKQWQKWTESTSYTTKDNKWEMKVLAKGEIGPNGLPVEVDTFVVREPGTPFSFVQHGLNMLPHNYTEEEEQQALALANSKDPIMRAARADLMSKAGSKGDNSSEFMSAYGFLPAGYFRKIRKTEEGSGGAFQKFRQSFREPARPATSPRGQRMLDSVSNSTQRKEDMHIDGIPYEEYMQGSQSTKPGMLSEASAAVAEQTGPPSPPVEQPPVPTAAVKESSRERHIATARGNQWSGAKFLFVDKPWVKGAIARFRRNLSLTSEQETEVVTFYSGKKASSLSTKQQARLAELENKNRMVKLQQ